MSTSSEARATEPARRAIHVVSRSEPMQRTIALAERVAPRNATVLITGETGTGKEVLAEHVHAASRRCGKRMVAINCAALPPSLLASTLFGHVRGAFTGAQTDAKGVFEEADGATLFLDEIGELPLEAQASLLRVIESKALIKVGAARETTVDVRLIAATHRDLRAMVRDGRFREDLFYRLNTIILEIPPLRERRCDIPLLADMFLAHLQEVEPTTARVVSEDALRTLIAHSFPGNVRELRNAIEHGAVMATGAEVRRADLPASLRCDDGSARENRPVTGDYTTSMRSAEVDILASALARAGGRQSRAAQLLAMPLRTFKYRLSKLGVTRARPGVDVALRVAHARH